MQRRHYLQASIATATTAVAGCTSAFESEAYDQSDEDQMFPDLSVFPDGWVRDDDYNEHYDAVFFNEDETIIVLMSVTVAESVGDAEDQYTEWTNRNDENEFTLADEAFWSERDDVADVGFRHSNALGECSAGRQSGLELVPDKSRAIKYAEEMYDHWQSIQ